MGPLVRFEIEPREKFQFIGSLLSRFLKPIRPNYIARLKAELRRAGVGQYLGHAGVDLVGNPEPGNRRGPARPHGHLMVEPPAIIPIERHILARITPADDQIYFWSTRLSGDTVRKL